MSTSSPRPVLSVPAHRFWARALRCAEVLVAVALMAPAGVAADAQNTPEAVEMRRVLGTIEDRVRIDLETAGGELEGSKVEVRVTPERVVRLEGRVASPEAKTRAGQVALYAVGVSKVDNQLEVDTRLAPPPPPSPPAVGAGAPAADPDISDEDLAKRVARRIAQSLPVEARAKNRWLGGWRVAGEGWSFDVDADDGKVRLDGRVREPVEIDELIARAREIPAVRSVDTSLTVVE